MVHIKIILKKKKSCIPNTVPESASLTTQLQHREQAATLSAHGQRDPSRTRDVTWPAFCQGHLRTILSALPGPETDSAMAAPAPTPSRHHHRHSSWGLHTPFVRASDSPSSRGETEIQTMDVTCSVSQTRGQTPALFPQR